MSRVDILKDDPNSQEILRGLKRPHRVYSILLVLIIVILLIIGLGLNMMFHVFP